MNRQKLAYVLSGFGILVVGCATARSDSDSQGSAATDLNPADEYLSSQAFRLLPRKVAGEVRAALAAAPGPLSSHAMVELFSSSKLIALSSETDAASCVQSGQVAALAIVDWAKSGAHTHSSENVSASADTKAATALAAMTTKLAATDVTQLDDAINSLSCDGTRDYNKCDGDELFTPPGCSDNNTDNSYYCNTTYSTCAMNDIAPDGRGGEDVGESGTALASLFREIDSVRPSRGMELEWSSLRNRYQAGLNHAARQTLKRARMTGSSTLATNADARRRYDAATTLADAFARGGVAPTTDSMNLLHSALAVEGGGALRTAGQEAYMGSAKVRRYLPGAAVAQATADSFANLRQRRANGEATPLVAATFGQRLISIHPYRDANGRTTRLMADWVLAQGGYPPALMNHAAYSSVLLWETPRVQRSAHLEGVTLGMRKSVELIEALG